MKYQSSRGKYSSIKAAEAIKMGLAPDGGLFVPETIPLLSRDILAGFAEANYQEIACEILRLYLEGFNDNEIKSCVYRAYNGNNFDHERIVPLARLADTVFIQELWHGPTSAFKDMALQILPYLLTASMRKTGENNDIIILVATSGDTGKAALEGFKDVPGTRIIVFFPEDGVSMVQKRQMITQEGGNVHVAGVLGNFDDAQNGVKRIFTDRHFIDMLAGHNMKMSSANSINWGRLLPQIVYYVSAYIDLWRQGMVKEGQSINVTVPTGNFGNILAAYYAREMGVPINRLICAANANNVLTDFINTGVYDRNRDFNKTISPSMDILISSNLERLLYEITGHDAPRVSLWMEQLKDKGRYEVDDFIHRQIQEVFWSDSCNDHDTVESIRNTWEDYHYLVDTHTAVAIEVYNRYREQTGDNRVTLIASTASPFKFGTSVAQAILPPHLSKDKNEFELLEVLADFTGNAIPGGIKDLDSKKILHSTVTSARKMEETVAAFLNI